MVKLLLDAGADVNARSGIGSESGSTPIIHAFRNPEMLDLLLQNGAEITVDVMYDGSSTCLNDLVTYVSIKYYDVRDGHHCRHSWEISLGSHLSKGTELGLAGSNGMIPHHQFHIVIGDLFASRSKMAHGLMR